MTLFELAILGFIAGYAIFGLTVMIGGMMCSPTELTKMRMKMFENDIKSIANDTRIQD